MSSELQRMIERAEACDGRAILATVVDVDGSTYRQPGARMLVTPDGQRIGTISGGCLERDLCRAAYELTEHGPRLVTFDTRENRLLPHGRYGMGCSGLVHVLLRPVTRERLQAWTRAAIDRQQVVSAIVYRSDGAAMPAVGSEWLIDCPEIEAGSRVPWPTSARAAIMSAATRMLDSQAGPHSARFCLGEQYCEVFFDRIQPARELLIIGAGEDALPLAGMAKLLDWFVTVTDRRAAALSTERFPQADRRRLLMFPVCGDQLALDESSAVVLMSHHFDTDRQLLPELLASSAGYVGILGPKRRTGKLLRQLHAEGRLPPGDQVARLRTPLGLDLGGSTPAEIAVAIVAEIIAFDHQRSGGPLTQRSVPIHHPPEHRVVDLAALAVGDSQ